MAVRAGLRGWAGPRLLHSKWLLRPCQRLWGVREGGLRGEQLLQCPELRPVAGGGASAVGGRAGGRGEGVHINFKRGQSYGLIHATLCNTAQSTALLALSPLPRHLGKSGGRALVLPHFLFLCHLQVRVCAVSITQPCPLIR